MRGRSTDRHAAAGRLAAVERELTERHASCGRAASSAEHGHRSRPTIDVVGFHGQTVLHAPERRLTVQIGDGAALARLTGHRRGLRPAGCRRGGRRPGRAAGAGLSPRARRPAARAAGGRAQYRRRRQRHLDRPRRHADRLRHRAGQCADRRLDAAPTGRADGCRRRAAARRQGRRGRRCRHCSRTTISASLPPKSLDRKAFGCEPVQHLSAEDGAATLAAFTAGGDRPGARAFPRAAAPVGDLPAAAGATDADGA